MVNFNKVIESNRVAERSKFLPLGARFEDSLAVFTGEIRNRQRIKAVFVEGRDQLSLLAELG